jgi:lysosomal Pro-X carboxypeptidase
MQALADYAALISSLLQSPNMRDAPVIAFGGSYGGMLSAWMRQKYPHLIDGAIAASAPVLAFAGLQPPFDAAKYWSVVTSNFDIPDDRGISCADKIRETWEHLFAAAATRDGRHRLARLLRLCRVPRGAAKGWGERVGLFLAMALDTIAMGNYPYPSSYLTGGPGAPLLPAWPARAACAEMAGTSSGDADGLLAGLGAAAGVYNNASRAEKCFALPQDESYAGIWDYQWWVVWTRVD